MQCLCLILILFFILSQFILLPNVISVEVHLNIVKKAEKNKNIPCPHRRSQISELKALMLQNVSSTDRLSKKKKHARTHLTNQRRLCVVDLLGTVVYKLQRAPFNTLL